MGKILLTRHGQTDWNLQDRILGRTDMELNATGLAQAEELAETLKDTHIDVIYSSTLRRAIQTVTPTAEAHGLPVIAVEELVEQDFGSCEGMGRLSEEYLREKHRYFARYPGGGESFLDLSARVYPFLRRVMAEHPDETVLLMTHGCICRVVMSFFQDMENEDFVMLLMKNGQVREFIY